MRILVINPDYYRSSGVTHAIARFKQAAEVLGDEVILISAEGAIKDNADTNVLTSIEDIGDLFAKSIPQVLHFLRRIVALPRRYNADIIVVHHRRIAILCEIVRPLLPCEVVYVGQVVYTYSPLFALFAPRFSVATSDSVKLNMAETMLSSVTATIANPGPLVNRVAPAIGSLQTKNAIVVARLEWEKNHSNLLKAISLVKRPDWRFKFLGEGSLKDLLVREAAELGISDVVEFCGYVSNVGYYIENANFCILVSYKEGLPLCVTEAAALGRATLLSSAPGAVDCIPKQSGLPNGVDPASSEDIARALSVWLTAGERLDVEGTRFHNKYDSEWNPITVYRKWRALINMATAKHVL